MTEKDTWSFVGLLLFIACLALILGIGNYMEGNTFEASLYFVVIVVMLSTALMVLIADRWYPERKGSFKVIVLALYAIVPIVFVLIHSQYTGDPGLALIAGITIGVLIGLVALFLILRQRTQQ